MASLTNTSNALARVEGFFGGSEWIGRYDLLRRLACRAAEAQP